ncbi:hypothetical protein BD779DRAFT_1789926 [Infundibulicybe gibba]|nr:hypothetical protein BD779DRAFT_1789926 [Infundibulicybe gibba]
MHPAIIPTLAYPTVRRRVACPPFTMCSRTLPFIAVLAYPATRRYACILHYPSPKLSHASSSSPGAEAALLRPYGSQCRIYPQSLGAAHIMVHTHDVSWAWEKKRTTERVGDDIAGQNGCGPRRGDGRVLDVGRGHGRLLGLVAYRLEIAREVMNRTLEVSSRPPPAFPNTTMHPQMRRATSAAASRMWNCIFVAYAAQGNTRKTNDTKTGRSHAPSPRAGPATIRRGNGMIAPGGRMTRERYDYHRPGRGQEDEQCDSGTHSPPPGTGWMDERHANNTALSPE